MESDNPIISFQDVSFAYEGASSRALDGITLDVFEGEFVCLLGGNGSGKTTLAKMVNALLLPDSGSVLTCGLDTSASANVHSIRQYAGMVFQNPDDQMVGNFIEDDVAFGPENLCLSSLEILERVNDALKQVGLQSFEKVETRSLSGGQKQRVAIAGALAMRPRILVLDEAGSMLDPRGRHGLLKACKRLNKGGLTVIYVTHFLDEAAEADKIVVMRDGRIAVTGRPSEVLENQRLLRELHLDTPFTVRVCDDLRELGAAVHVHLSEDGLVDELNRSGFSSSRANEGIGGSANDTRVPASNESDAILRLRNVSYSYLGKHMLKKALRERANSSNGHQRDIKESQDETKWGSDPEAIWALNGISLSIHKGDFLGIIGHTGSGKSTLLRILGGLVKPSSGEALLGDAGSSLKKASDVVRESIGIVMQYPEKQLFAQTVFEDCAFGPRNLGLSEQEVEERVTSALRLVGLEGDAVLNKSPFQLSGGQQRRVAIAGVLAMRPKLLILDEPTAGLDPAGCRSLLRLIRTMHSKYEITIVMVSHNMDSIAYLCNRVLVLNRGREFFNGTPIEVFSHGGELRKIGLGLPSALTLAEMLDIKGFNYVPKTEQLSEAIIGGLPFASSISCDDGLVLKEKGGAHE